MQCNAVLCSACCSKPGQAPSGYLQPCLESWPRWARVHVCTLPVLAPQAANAWLLLVCHAAPAHTHPPPQVLLLDEPFGALDPTVRASLREGLRAIVKRLGVTTIIVTHDQVGGGVGRACVRLMLPIFSKSRFARLTNNTKQRPLHTAMASYYLAVPQCPQLPHCTNNIY